MPPRIGILSFPDETSDYLIQKMPTYKTLHVSPFYLQHKYTDLKKLILKLILILKSRQGQGIFLFYNLSRMALGPTQPPRQWML
jgi:hypothetical protein